MNIPAKVWGWALVIVVAAFALWRSYAGIVEKGVLKEQLRVADSVAVVRLAEQKAAHDSAVEARAETDRFRVAARAEVRRDSVIRLRTDSTIRASSDERTAARLLLQDSLATLSDLRSEVGRLVAVGVADSLAHSDERQSAARVLHAFQTAAHRDSLAIAKGVDAENAAIARAVAAESQVILLRKSRPSTFWRVAERAAWAGAVVYLAARP